MAALPFADLGEAKVDIHRHLRQGFPEVVLGEGKTPGQIAKIAARLSEGGGPVLVTRVSPQASEQVLETLPDGSYDPSSRTLVYNRDKVKPLGKGTVLVISAGTSDLPVAEEASVTAEVMGNKVERLYDVGVSGIHRLFSHLELIREARVIIVVAGMEGALASVVGGLVAKPFTDPVTPNGPTLEKRFGVDVAPLRPKTQVLGFAVAGEDKKFVWADEATIDGDCVVVSSKAVAKPVAVRYAWENNPVCSLYSKEGLPACPFRSDDWKGVTADAK